MSSEYLPIASMKKLKGDDADRDALVSHVLILTPQGQIRHLEDLGRHDLVIAFTPS
jgi:hypothetical protein